MVYTPERVDRTDVRQEHPKGRSSDDCTEPSRVPVADSSAIRYAPAQVYGPAD